MFRIFENIYRFVRLWGVRIFCGKKIAIKDYLRRYLYVTKIVQGMQPHQTPKYKMDVSPANRVWTMWLQEERPEIIQMGLDSIFCFCPQTVIITDENLSQYLDIPSIFQLSVDKDKLLVVESSPNQLHSKYNNRDKNENMKMKN